MSPKITPCNVLPPPIKTLNKYATEKLELSYPASLLTIAQNKVIAKHHIQNHPQKKEIPYKNLCFKLSVLLLCSKIMDLVTCMTILLALGTYFNGVVTLEECTGQGQSPEVKLGISVRKPGLPASNEVVSLNKHLQPNPKIKPLPRSDGASPKFLEDQAASSVIFNEIQSLVLTKSSYKIVSYVSFEPHIKTFSEIDDLLQTTMDKTNTYMQTKSFPPYYRQLPGEVQVVQERKDWWIGIQLKELSYELHLVTRNFELIKKMFLEITGQSPSHLDPPPKSIGDTMAPIEPIQPTRLKRSVVSSIFKFLFGGEDNSEAINMLKQNIATLLANDELQEKCLKDILKSQQINAGEI